MKVVFVAVGMALLTACGGSGGSSSTGPSNNPPPTGNTPPPVDGISVVNNSYTPGTKTITVGSTVKWAWNTCTGDGYNGQTCTSHSVTFDDGPTSPTQDQGTFNRTFNTAGTYTYHCAVHGALMTGTITVQ